jgi:hypothetical protein
MHKPFIRTLNELSIQLNFAFQMSITKYIYPLVVLIAIGCNNASTPAAKEQTSESAANNPTPETSTPSPSQNLQGPSAEVEAEILHVIKLIGASGATIVRNGRPMESKDAALHFESKYKVMKKEITSFDDFIQKAMTTSKASNQPYSVTTKEGAVMTLPNFIRTLR